MTKFTQSLFKVILPLASLGFFLVASLVVLIISQGRIFDEDGSIVETGIIRVTAIPKDNLKAYINNEEVPFSEFRITNITPGVVTLKLAKEGYTPWEKQVKVESGFVKDVFAQLYPDTIPFTKVIQENAHKVFYAPDDQFIYYTVLDNRGLNGIWRLKLTRNLLDFANPSLNTQIIKLNEVESNQLLTNDYNLLISSDNNRVILNIDNTDYFLYNLSDSNVKTDLSNLLGTKPENVAWFKGSESITFTKDNKYAFEYEINSKQTSLITADENGLNHLAISFNNIYFVKDQVLYRYSNKSTAPFELTAKLKPLIPSSLSQIYTPRDNQNALILESEDSLIYLDLQKNYIDVIDVNASLLAFANNGRTLLYQKEGKTYSYYVEESLSGDSYTTYNYDLAINTEDVDTIKFTSTSNTLVTVSKEGKITLMDYDGLNKRQILNEFKLTGNKLLFTNSNTEIYALVQEINEEAETVNNLYKFELQLKQ